MKRALADHEAGLADYEAGLIVSPVRPRRTINPTCPYRTISVQWLWRSIE
jgi:hypothetical protein